MRFLFLLFILNIYVFSLDFTISSRTSANAKTQFLEFKKQKSIKYEKLVVGKRLYGIYPHPTDNTKMYALLPSSYYDKPSQKTIEILYRENSKKKKEFFKLNIKDAKYKKEKIQVQKSKVNPKSKAIKKRTAKEYKEAMDIYGYASRKSYIKEKFILPLNSKITSDFGKARVYNDELKGYHSGTDFRAKLGTKILASNDGKVVLVQDRFYSGNSVIIDHGQGIYTCYYHMSEFKVKKNEFVSRGQSIGLSGDTGRVTGPHLHFSARVGGLQVDPLQLIRLLNKELF